MRENFLTGVIKVMQKFQILSLIGGGIRGAFVTSYLYELEQRLGEPLASKFDLIAGTSTGGIIAAGLALGETAETMHKFYVDHGASIFPPRAKYVPKGLLRYVYPLANWISFKKTGKTLDSIFQSRFCPDELEEALKLGYGERTLGDIFCTRLIMPAVNLTKGEPHVFRSAHLPKGLYDKDIKLTDAVIATTAAPTYFPQKVIGENAFVDGGVWASDPSILAIAEAIRIQQFEKRLDPEAEILTNNIHLLSVGTGRAQYSLEADEGSDGLLFWASKITDLMSTCQSKGIHLPLKFFLQDRYHHINFKMETKWKLDDVSNIPKLFKLGKEKADLTYDRVKKDFLEHEPTCFVPFTDTSEEIFVEDLEY